MDLITIIGLLAGTMTTVSFIPQLIRTVKYKNTQSISLGMYSIFTFGVLVWLFYGIVKKDIAIIVANIITLTFTIIILILKLKYK